MLIDLETCFDIKIESNFEFNTSNQLHDNKRQLVGTLSENSQSIANAETEDEECTPGASAKKLESTAGAQSLKNKKTKTIMHGRNSTAQSQLDQREQQIGGTEGRNLQKKRNES